ncbi:MAG: hypothetical protein JO372_03890 [Solirubrobacterales bacterium]|nr:hypothetical protein [Solirubrobacterales bacterium]
MTTPIRLVLEIEPVEDSLIGRISSGEGESRPFAGWLGLFNALEALIEEQHPRADHVPGGT